MKRIVLTFGLISGAVLSAMMLVSTAFMDEIGFDRSQIVGYTTMVLAFLLVYFGIRSYRETVGGGAISFGRALGVGGLIVLVAGVCYVATWQVIYYRMAPDFVEKYAAHAIEKTRASGASEAELAAKRQQMARYADMYRNPFVNIAFTFIEVLPVGLVMTLVSAGILRRPQGLVSASAGRIDQTRVLV
jgi:hypothetical protein